MYILKFHDQLLHLNKIQREKKKKKKKKFTVRVNEQEVMRSLFSRLTFSKVFCIQTP